jgi:hypothetical protein
MKSDSDKSAVISKNSTEIKYVPTTLDESAQDPVLKVPVTRPVQQLSIFRNDRIAKWQFRKMIAPSL